MATQAERLAALEDYLQPARTGESMDSEARLAACEAAAPSMVRSPSPRDLATRFADLEAYVAIQRAATPA